MATVTSTIVSTDVVDSTVLRTRLGEERADLVFRQNQHALQEVVAAHSGRVVKTAGDGLLATFDSATDAVRATVAMQQRVSREADALRLRIGLAAGDVSWERGDCSGLPVVTAARLEAHADGGQILATGLVRQLAGDRSAATFRPVGQLTLKGLAEPVESFEVGWAPLADDRGTTARSTVPCPAAITVAPAFAFVGRLAERHELDRVWAAVKAGEPHVALIGAEAGAGKTRLAFEFARRCSAEGATVLLGVCDTELALPYQPWVQVLDHLVRAMPAELTGSLTEELAELSLLLPQLERLVPGLVRTPSADPETERYRLFSAVESVLADAARRWPTVVVLDDLHWAGAQTLAVLRLLARSGSATRLLVIGTFRDTGDEITDPLASCLADLRRTETTVRLRLGGLDGENVERFVASAVGHELDRPLREVAATIAEHSGGNAFYIGELWRHLVAGGVVAEGGDRWTVRTAALGVGVPDSVREVVGDRLTRLSPAARRLVELAAVAGQRVERQVLAIAAAQMGTGEVGDGLDELAEANLLSEVGGVLPTYQFVHAIVRGTVEQAIRPSAKARLHLQVAEALEDVHEADRRPVLAELARHFTAAAALGGPAK
ncbi:MAG: AAA family ATPase, partial [Acidimicrobiia bacterium]|nr:AAA family ATPase [Acidimicrobiia bacterium]